MTGAIGSNLRMGVGSLTMGKNMTTGSSGNDFLSVWRNQTSGNQTDSTANETAQKISQSPKAGSKDSPNVKNQDKTQKTLAEESDVEETDDTQEALDGQTLETIMQILAASAEKFAGQIAQELGISPEELNGLMQELGMDQMDLLNPESLTELVLAAGGAQDTFDLLTNGELYQTLQNLNAGLEDMMAQVSQETGLGAEELAELMEQMKTAPENEAEEPVISIEIQEQPEEIAEENQNKTNQTAQDTISGDKALSEKTQESSQKGNSHHKQETGSGRENPADLFMQNLNGKLDFTEVFQTDNTSVFSAPDTESIMKQLLDYMKIQLKPDMTNLEMQLHPQNLGTLHVQLTTRQGAVTAQFITQNESVKAALESQMIQLQESFEEQGVKVDAIEVSVQSQEFNRNMDQSNSGQGRETSGRKHQSRKINLNFPVEMENLSEEEQITADLMAANGNTVDYTV